MATATQFIDWIKQFNGRRDNGGSFIWRLVIPKHQIEAWFNGLAYCGATVVAACDGTSTALKPITTARRMFYVPHIVIDARNAGLWKRPTPGAGKPGDLPIHDWGGDGVGDHVTVLIEDNPAKDYIVVIGGNHGDGVTNGERGVFVRTFKRSTVLGYVDRKGVWTAPPKTPTTTAPAAKAKPVLYKGSKGIAVAKLQADLVRVFPAYATPIKRAGGADGIFGTATEGVVREFQRRCGLTGDGVVGVATWAALGRVGIKP